MMDSYVENADFDVENDGFCTENDEFRRSYAASSDRLPHINDAAAGILMLEITDFDAKNHGF